MRSMIAIEDFRYASRDLKSGEPFEAESDSDVLVLKAARKAKEAESVETRALKAGDAVAEEKPGAVKSKRYDRRDMRVKD